MHKSRAIRDVNSTVRSQSHVENLTETVDDAQESGDPFDKAREMPNVIGSCTYEVLLLFTGSNHE
jgi:hypothetical protein